MRSVELLILDFDGVCTRSSSEIAGDPSKPVARVEAIELVRRARRGGITSVVLSNEISADWVNQFAVLDEVDAVVNCADNQIFKPDRRAYLRCLLLTGHEAERTLVVDDGVDNINVARSLGMRTVLFDTTAPELEWERISTELGLDGSPV